MPRRDPPLNFHTFNRDVIDIILRFNYYNEVCPSLIQKWGTTTGYAKI